MPPEVLASASQARGSARFGEPSPRKCSLRRAKPAEVLARAAIASRSRGMAPDREQIEGHGPPGSGTAPFALQWGPALGTGRDWRCATACRARGCGFNGARPWGPGGTQRERHQTRRQSCWSWCQSPGPRQGTVDSNLARCSWCCCLRGLAARVASADPFRSSGRQAEWSQGADTESLSKSGSCRDSRSPRSSRSMTTRPSLCAARPAGSSWVRSTAWRSPASVTSPRSRCPAAGDRTGCREAADRIVARDTRRLAKRALRSSAG